MNEKLGVTPTVQLLELEKGQIDLMGDPLPNSSYLDRGQQQVAGQPDTCTGTRWTPTS